LVALLVALWAFLFNVYDIGLIGNAKDLWNPVEKHNLLKRWTFFDEHGNVMGVAKRIVWIFWVLRGVVSTAIAYVMLWLVIPNILNLALLTVLTVVELYLTVSTCRVLTRGPVMRGKLLSLAGASEAVEFFRIASLTAMPWPFVFMTYGMIYFVLLNKLLWGTRLAPRV